MALGRRKNERQQDFWVATTELPRSEGHVFYQKLNQLLREAGIDEYVETLCEPHYHDTMGRPGIPPGTYRLCRSKLPCVKARTTRSVPAFHFIEK